MNLLCFFLVKNLFCIRSHGPLEPDKDAKNLGLSIFFQISSLHFAQCGVSRNDSSGFETN